MASGKPILLICIEWFTPGYKAGGPIASCLNVARLLQDDYQVYVLTSDTDHGEETAYREVLVNQWLKPAGDDFMVYYVQKKNIGFNQIKQVIQTLTPDFIYLNNMYSLYYVLYPVWLKWTGQIQANIIITPRGTLYETALAVKPLKKKIFISVFRRTGIFKKLVFQATSVREKEAIEKFFPGSKIKTIDDLPATAQTGFQVCTKTTGSLKCIFIARIVDIKNLLFLLKQLAVVKGMIQLTIAGPVEDAAYWKLCLAEIEKLPANINVQHLGAQPPHALHALLLAHHLFILPTKGENFGHAIFEALLAGRPVLISDQTPWLHLKEKGIGWDLPIDAGDAFVQAIIEATAWDQDLFNERSAASYQYAKQYLLTAGYKSQYCSLFQ